MCGIFFYAGRSYSEEELREHFQKIQHRGPDESRVVITDENAGITAISKNEGYIPRKMFFGFHRLAIMGGLEEASGQPMVHNGIYLICNGEIFNYAELRDRYGFVMRSGSDCEIILHMYERFGIERTVAELDAEFAFVLWDSRIKSVFIARDPLGIRSLFLSYGSGNDRPELSVENIEIFIASEAKALTGISSHYIHQFPAGKWSEFNLDPLTSKLFSFNGYFPLEFNRLTGDAATEAAICAKLRELVTAAVDKRMMSSRKIATLLSGGLDSTLVTALVKRHIPDGQLDTYSIGLQGSVDLHYARQAAEYLKTNHHEVVVTEEEFLGAIRETIQQIESWDTTSIRASVGNYLVSKYIRANSDNVVIFCGDLSDEIFASYRGFMQAPTATNFYDENVRMIRDVQYFDLLRSDKSISGAGLEARVPFGDNDLIKYVMSIPPELKMFSDARMEKYLLRKAFDDPENPILPRELLYRRKEAFSDGVSSHERSWFQIIREFVDTQVSNREYEQELEKFEELEWEWKEDIPHPYDKESYYYLKIFQEFYPGHEDMIPYYWRHPFSENKDPSARLLECYRSS
jgi:asparagine synthase (glutamine-hydrolysing)